MKKKVINIIVYLLIIVLLYISIIINKDYSAIINKKYINSYNDLINYSNYKFLTLDLSKSKETRFSLQDKNKKSIMYILTLDKKTILIELSNSTVVTNKIDVMYKKDNSSTKLLKYDIEDESDKDIEFTKGYYSNINLSPNVKIIKIKFYITVALVLICLLMMIVNLYNIVFKKKIDY